MTGPTCRWDQAESDTIWVKVKLMVSSNNNKKKPCDGITDIVFIFVDMFSGQHYTIQHQKLFFVKTPYTFRYISCLFYTSHTCFNKVHLYAVKWNIPCYSSYTHKSHKLIISATLIPLSDIVYIEFTLIYMLICRCCHGLSVSTH